MLGSIYKGLAGMLSFSNGLSGISSNVGNLNTTAYKKNDNSFTSLVSHNGTQNDGVKSLAPQMILAQGDLKETGENTDVSIEGAGFFVIEKNGEYLLTRDGQFRFSQDGFLTLRDDDAFVMVNVNGSLQKVNSENYQDGPFKVTSEVELKGKLLTKYDNHTISDVIVIDGSGNKRTLTIEMTTLDTEIDNQWFVEVYEDDKLLTGPVSIEFLQNGTPKEGFNKISMSIESDRGIQSDFTINFGEAGLYSGVQNSNSNTGESTAAFEEQDGNELGSLSNISIDEYGRFQFNYSNEEERTGPQLAITNITSPDHLISFENNMFRLDNSLDLKLVDPRAIGATISGGKLELSNVELSQEFSEMIIVQRGYQASSQVMTTANEMLQQLLEATKG
ncbi:flagellar hook-basal body complex protein [Marinicellulosiphila megalodicopiae]|uniref:flagellar hook-basal body complex protein n=1 Tax=Marinicellulosiphila megalodicopiae TaxID=2724896 RepID=UPI003BB1D9E3